MTGCITEPQVSVNPTDVGYDSKGEISVRVEEKQLDDYVGEYDLDIMIESYQARCDNRDILLNREHTIVEAEDFQSSEVYSFDVIDDADYTKVIFKMELNEKEEAKTFFSEDTPECIN
jgi:hypothetical protein